MLKPHLEPLAPLMALAAALSLVLLGGCTANVVETQGAGGASAAHGSGSHQGSSSSGQGSASSTASGSGGTAQCGPDAVDQSDPCEVCVVNACTLEALICCQTPGCLEIVDCAKATGCTGIDCYTEQTCKAVIDAAGGPGEVTNDATALGDCALESCAAECGG